MAIDASRLAKLGEIGKYLKRIKPDFDTRNYGLKKLSDFFEMHSSRYETRTSNGSGLQVRLITKASAEKK